MSAAYDLVVDPAMNLIERTLMRRITHRRVDFMNEDVLQALTDRDDLVPPKWAIEPVEKSFQPNAEIRCRHCHTGSMARFYRTAKITENLCELLPPQLKLVRSACDARLNMSGWPKAAPTHPALLMLGIERGGGEA